MQLYFILLPEAVWFLRVCQCVILCCAWSFCFLFLPDTFLTRSLSIFLPSLSLALSSCLYCHRLSFQPIFLLAHYACIRVWVSFSLFLYHFVFHSSYNILCLCFFFVFIRIAFIRLLWFLLSNDYALTYACIVKSSEHRKIE